MSRVNERRADERRGEEERRGWADLGLCYLTIEAFSPFPMKAI